MKSNGISILVSLIRSYKIILSCFKIFFLKIFNNLISIITKAETKKIANERKKNIKKFYVPKDWRFIMAKDEVNRKRYDLIEKYSSEHNGLRVTF